MMEVKARDIEWPMGDIHAHARGEAVVHDQFAHSRSIVYTFPSCVRLSSQSLSRIGAFEAAI